MKNNNPRAKEVKRRPNVKVRLDVKKEKNKIKLSNVLGYHIKFLNKETNITILT
jgi:hypothetical protein